MSRKTFKGEWKKALRSAGKYPCFCSLFPLLLIDQLVAYISELVSRPVELNDCRVLGNTGFEVGEFFALRKIRTAQERQFLAGFGALWCL